MKTNKSDRLGLQFRDVNVKVEVNHILKNVFGGVEPGQFMAVMGPSGAGKTTLMNCLAGRSPVTSGEITIGGLKLTKDLRRRVCYVLQEDAFFPKLTLQETLWFVAMIRLPEDIPEQEKLKKLDSLIDDLDLRKCLSTPMGGMWLPGLSGGEIKRASIACELITDPNIILLDEPTSGLDYKTAYSLIRLLKTYASRHQKTVVATIHQPSSQMFFQFDLLLLMSGGETLFYGPPREIGSFFSTAGFPIAHHYNPADFMLEKVKETAEVKEKLVQVSYDTRTIFTPDGQDLDHRTVRTWNRLLWKPKTSTFTETNNDTTDVEANLVESKATSKSHSGPKWATGFATQYKILTQRAFKLSRSNMLDKFRLFETAFLCAMLSLIWFQLQRSEETLSDRMGLIYYISMHWGFTPLFNAITSFPAERVVIYKERSSSWYRLSAYYLAKMTCDLPSILVEPLLFLTVVYWVTGLNNVVSFFATIGTIFVHTIVGQSIGLCIGIYAMDMSRGISLGTICIMFIMLIGGFYARHLPFWLEWAKYLAFLHYTFHALMYLEFYQAADLQCSQLTNSTKSHFDSCNHSNQTTLATFPAHDALRYYNINQPFWQYFLPLLAFFGFFRVLGYMLLRFYQKPNKM
ncbi:uncharacterized protein LOC127871196 [Dreissena polymorpha]|uniref:ABC transporter domain-containing protein n=1 Tax=Dreissena polymorpha TaxID=45954 RepID=A0A9D4MKD4_DREPO|nr:uncharacterized protein LOC127871196 [Dreissena polymorpha]KAH3877254.1 hypothetical protein DPMN_001116 [Dreissena polymorpha]